MRITTLETVHNHKKIIKKIAWWYHRKLVAIPMLAVVFINYWNQIQIFRVVFKNVLAKKCLM